MSTTPAPCEDTETEATASTTPPACEDIATEAPTDTSEADSVPRRGVLSILWNWETPAAYRGRLRVAVVLVVVAVLARYLNGGERLPIEKLFNNVLYSSTSNAEDSFGYTIVYGPNFGVLILSLLVRFMMHRPREQHEHAE